MSGLRKNIDRIFLVVVAVLALSGNAFAVCKGSIINPVTDVCWKCMFPAKIGVPFGGGEGPTPGYTDSPVCFCASGASITAGVSAAFKEASRLIETVKDPYCFPSLGTSMGGNSASAMLAGSQSTISTSDENAGFQEVHYFIFPAWVLMNLFGDMPCIEKRPFDVGYMTEVDYLWRDSQKAFIINPEAGLFGNMVTQLSCAADSVASAVGMPLDPLFWCFGSWGSAYPLTGDTGESIPVTYNAQMAARMIFKLGREGLLWDTAINKCASEGVLSPIMIKDHYTMNIARPVRGNDCIPIGRSPLIWGAGKNPPIGGSSPDNFLWVLNRARTCCVGYSP